MKLMSRTHVSCSAPQLFAQSDGASPLLAGLVIIVIIIDGSVHIVFN